MTLTSFEIAHARGDAAPMLGDPLVRCESNRQLVLAYISQQALRDYFRIPGDRQISLEKWNLVVDRNLDAFKGIIESKFKRDDWEIHNTMGQSYPKLIITLEDMQKSGEEFTIEILNTLDGSSWQSVR